MVNTVKFSQFAQADISDPALQTVGLSGGANTREPKFTEWTTSTRPVTPYPGLLGYNSTLVAYEFWDGTAWIQFINADLSIYALKGANADINSMSALTGTLSAPTGIASNTGASLLNFIYNTGAVNYFEVRNAPTGFNPRITATGPDSFVEFVVSSKGGVFGVSDEGNAVGGALSLASASHMFNVGFKAPDVLAANTTWILPSADGAAGTILYTNGSATLAFTTAAYPATAGTSGNVMTSDGTNWISSPIPGVTGHALTEIDDTNVTLTLGGTPATALLQAVSLTLGWTGQLSGTRGGTGVNNGASTMTVGGNFSMVGAFTFAGTVTGNTAVTFPTSGTLATTGQLPTGAALTEVNDTNVTLTLGGSPSTALLNAASLTLGWTGTLSGTRGGTGVNNGGNTATFAGNLNFANSFTTSGNFAVTQTYTGITNVTFPTSGTLATTSQLPSGAALTEVNDTNVTLTLGGTPATALLQAVSLTLGWTGQLGLTRGGTNASLTASNGGIVYSTASAMAILAGTTTAGQHLQSGSSSAPSWTTTTYPSTNAINTIMYASSANVLGVITPVNSAVLISSAGGVPSWSTTLPTGLTIPGIMMPNGDGITDTSGNSIVIYTTVASPVNSIVMGNAATGNNPQITGSGSDTNVTLSLVGKGTGGVQIQGTGTNNNAAAGFVGEFISSIVTQGSGVGLSTNTAANITSISLTAGDWDVWGNVAFLSATTTVISDLNGWISTTTASLPTGNLRTQRFVSAGFTPGVSNESFCVPYTRISVASTTTVFLSVRATFMTSTLEGSGGIYARRVR